MESGEIFENSSLMSNSFATFHEMKHKKKFCDLTIEFGNLSISTHRIVIAAGIPYFEEKLANQNTEIFLIGTTYSNLDADALECLIEFSYTGKIQLTTENVRAILPTASFLRIDSVIDACCRYIVKLLKPEEVLSVRQYAEDMSSSKLIETIDRYVCNHFDEVSACEIFLDAPFCYVKELICRDDLRPSKEEKVLEFVIKWVKKLPDEREVYLADLLVKVRMTLVHPDYLTDCFNEGMIACSIPCRNVLKDALTFHFLPHRRAMISSFETSGRGCVKQRPKGNERWTSGIYAVCSAEPIPPVNLPSLNVQYFDPVSKEWSLVDVLSFTLRSVTSSLIQYNGKLYFYDAAYITAYDSQILCSNDSFYVGQRFNAGVAVAENTLYICGGTTADTFFPLNTMICFDFQKNSRKIINMPGRGSHFGAVSFNGYLYLLGGIGENGQPSNSMWKYDFKSQRWSELARMKRSRCAMGCAVLDGKIYACGGIIDDGMYRGVYSCGRRTVEGVTQTTEVFDPLINKWIDLPDMRAERFGFSLVPFDGKLYAIGGKLKEQGEMRSTCSVDVFDPETGNWEYCSVFPRPVEWMKAIVIERVLQ